MKILPFIAMAIAIFVSAAEIDICVPSFPDIKNLFNLSAFSVEMILSVNLIFHCIAAIFVGNLADKYGKRKIMNFGFLIFALGTLLCILSKNYPTLIIGRIIQGIGSSAPMVLAPLFIMDLYNNKQKQEKMMNILNGICTIAICTAPTIGSYATLVWNWQANFTILLAFTLVALFFNLFLPKSTINTQTSKVNFAEYKIIFSSKLPMMYILSCTIAIGLYYTFVGMAPIIYINALNVDLKHYGFYQGALTLAFGIFSIISPLITNILGKKTAFLASISLIFSFLVSYAYIIINNVQNPLFITLSTLLLSIGAVIPVNILYIGSLSSIPNMQGRISAVLTVLKWVFSSIGIQIASYFYASNFKSTGITMFVMEIISLSIGFYIFKLDKNFRSSLLASKSKN